MPPPYFDLGSLTLSTYTALVGIGILLTGVYALYHTEQPQRSKTADVLLAGIIGGIIVGRVEHVLLNWSHFAYNQNEILQIASGGVDWHGALIGGGVGMLIVSRWRKVALAPLMDRLTIGLPLIGLLAWWGCGAASCAYGKEVATLSAYPEWVAWEGRDIFGIYAPRFQTQFIAMLLMGALLIITLLLLWRGWLVGFRFGLILMLTSVIMFGVGFLRGDYAPIAASLRVDQWLDLIFVGVGFLLLLTGNQLRSAIVR